MNIESLKMALAKEKATLLNLKVLRKISSNTFLVGDASAMAILSDPNKAKVKLNEGDFVKIIKPVIKEGKVICNDKFGLVRGTHFQCENKETDIEEFTKTISDIEKIPELADFANISAFQHIPKIVLKICSISRPYTGKFSDYRNIIAKDISGNKVTVTLYKKLKDFCQQGDVYVFLKLKKSDYKASSETFNRLSSTSMTEIEKVGIHHTKQFQQITVGDEAFDGQFVGKKI